VVVSDADGEVFERAAEGNNLTASTQALRLTHPDLVVDSVSLPGGNAAESGSNITVNWVGRNAGSGTTTANWVDRVYLSTDATRSADDILLGSLPHSGAVDPVGTYNGSIAARLPDGVTGSMRILVVSDAASDVLEGVGEGNNIAASGALSISLAPYADLTVTRVDAPPLLIGDPVDLTVTWEVRNDGTGPGTVNSWLDRVVLSRDQVLGNADDLVLGEFEHTGGLPVGVSYPRTETFPLPPATGARFFLFVKTDATNVVYEHTDAASNVGTPGHPVDVVRKPYSDLVVDEVTVDATGQMASSQRVLDGLERRHWIDRPDPVVRNVYLSRDTTFGMAMIDSSARSRTPVRWVSTTATRALAR